MSNLVMRAPTWRNDIASDFLAAEAKRQSFNDGVVSQCKKEHPVAKNLGNTAGGKPYVNCVNDKMARYDDSVDAATRMQKLKEAQALDEKAAEAQRKANSETAQQQIQLASVTSVSDVANADARKTTMVVGGGIAMILLLLFLLFSNNKKTVPVSAPK